MFSPIFPVKKGLAAVNSSPIPGLCLALWAKRKPQKQARRAGRKMVKVKSKTYKPHERAPRGTHKKAELNDAMKADGERMRNANDPARLINGSLELYRENFPASQIWPKLVSHFAGQAKQGIPYSLVGISDWNIDMHQPSHKVISGFRGFRVEVHSTMMEISVNYEFCKRFLEKRKEIDGFRVTIITLFPDY